MSAAPKIAALTVVMLALLSACTDNGQSSTQAPVASQAEAKSMLDELNGVWKASDENTSITIIHKDKKTSFFIDETALPVKVGDIDTANSTVNFTFTQDREPRIWTIKQVWDNETKESFHLLVTLHDSSQHEFSFIRRISQEDMTRLANAEARQNNSQGVASVSVPAPATSATPSHDAQAPVATAPQQSATAVSQAASAPVIASFDCRKAASRVERLVCSDAALASADKEFATVYSHYLKNASRFGIDVKAYKNEQRDWLKTVRDTCPDIACLRQSYGERQLSLIESYGSE